MTIPHASISFWTEEDQRKERARFDASPLVDKLRKRAEAERQRAENFRGCSFVGEWPGNGPLREANLLDAAANEIERLQRFSGEKK